MKSEQPASQERPVLEIPTKKFDEAASSKPERSSLGQVKPVDADISSVITGELLQLIRKLTDEKPKPKLQRVLSHPLAIVVASFILSIPLGGYLTYVHSLREQEAASRRSFSDELNKIRIQKIGEVWEQLDKTEAEVDELLDSANKAPSSNKNTDGTVDSILKIFKDNTNVLNKNRFWLGEQTYNRIKAYLDIEGQYSIDKLLGKPGIDLTETIKRRDQAKQDILQIRNMFLKGEPEP